MTARGSGRGGVQLVIVGSVALDTVETPCERRASLLGGSVSYAAAAASYFARTGVVGVVGEDFPAAAMRLYRRLGIDVAGLETRPGKTFRWSGVYDADLINRRTLATELNVFADFAPRLPEAYRRAPFLMLGNIAPELQLHVLRQAKAPRLVAADTMDLWIDTRRAALARVIRKVDVLLLNDAEARQLTGEHNLRRAARRVLDMGPRYAVIKKGEHGALVFSRAGVGVVPAYPVARVVDPTGAGDAFAGAFLGRLARAGRADDRAVRQALLTGSVVASFNVEAFSLDRLARLRPPQIAARLDALRAMLRA